MESSRNLNNPLKNIDCNIDLQSTSAGKALYTALHSTGYAILSNHNVSIDLLKDITEKWKPFFLDKKNTITSEQIHQMKAIFLSIMKQPQKKKRLI